MKTYKEWLQTKLLKENVDQGWYIVDQLKRISSGPYQSQKEAKRNATQKQWYIAKPENYDILYGYVDENDSFHQVKPDQIASKWTRLGQ